MLRLLCVLLFFVLSIPSSFAQKLVPCGKGYCDEATEKEVIPPRFDETFPFRHGYAIVRMGKKYRAIDSSGHFVTEKSYKDLSVTDVPGLFLAQRKKRKYGLIRPGDQVALPLEQDYIALSDEDHFAEIGPGTLLELIKRKRGKYYQALVRPDGKFLVQYSRDSSFIVAKPDESTKPPLTIEEARYVLYRGNDCFVFDGNGRQLGAIPGFFGFWGMNIVTIDGSKIGFQRASDLAEIPAPENLKQNYWSILMNGKWGFISRTGEVVVPAEYDDYHYSFSPVTESPTTPVIVKVGNQWGVIDLRNTQIIPFIYEEIFPISNYDPLGETYFAVKEDGQYGVADPKGKIIGTIRFNEIETTTNGREFRVRQKKKWGTMSLNGDVKWDE